MTADTGTGAVPGTPARPRRRGVWILLAAVTAVLMVAPIGFRVAAHAFRRTTTETTPYHLAIKDVRLDMGDARVTVGAGPEGEGRVHKRLTWAPTKPTVNESLVDGVLYITFRCNSTVRIYGGLECGGDIDVRVPRAARVSAVSESGQINVRGLTGDLDLRTGSGEIAVADARGRLRLRANSGTVRGTGIAASKTQAEVGSGELNLRYAEPPDIVDAAVGSGSARIIVPPGSHYRLVGPMPSHLGQAVVDDRSTRVISLRGGSGRTYLDYRDE
ncbi:DUF4097 family beta strand repeat-containing protein [Actinomadura litoris]|uniref:DUF4097 domain-containing protein n=1 Tax=Actinomadura litoris TaxID=2678616 RepID=A0A7K1KUS8_9ACTN|nr:DUF4097 family beta strand repeat-containing protein [Actinomadura litoris]MUN35941.1 hypothetical protein [Actinomadura litoris]